MECICDKTIHIKEFENLHIYFKTKVMGGIFSKFKKYIFMNAIDIHELNLGPFINLNLKDKIPLKNLNFIFNQ
jgi:hypothetical protein